MKKALKIAAIAVGSIVVLIIAAVIILSVIINPNDYKPQITSIVKENTGRDLHINGDIELKFFPWIRFSVKDVKLSNAAGFMPEHMVSFKEVSVGVKVLPLLKKKVEISNVVVDSLELNYTVNKKNVTNLDDILAKTKKEPAAPKEDKPSEPSKGLPINEISIPKIIIKNMQLVYSDQPNNKLITINPLNIEAENVALNKPLNLRISGKVITSAPKTEVTFDINSVINAVLSDKIEFKSVTVTSKINVGANLIEQGLKVVLDSTLDAGFDNTNQIASVKSLKAKVDAQGNSIPGGTQSVNVAIAPVTVDLNKETLDLSVLEITAANVTAQLTAKGANIKSSPNIKANFAVKEFSPKDLMAKLNLAKIETKDPNALTKSSMSFSMEFKDKVLNIPNMVLNLDSINVNNAVKVDLNKAKPNINVSVKVSDINADGYMPPANTARKEPVTAKAPTKATKKQETIKVDLTPLPDVNANVNIKSIKVSGIKADAIKLTAILSNGKLTINPLSLMINNAKLTNMATVTGNKNVFKVVVSSDLTPLNIKKLLADVTGKPAEKNMPDTASYKITAGFENNVLTVNSINVNVDRINLTGNASVTLQNKPAVKFRLATNDINLNRYLPAENKNSAKQPETKPQGQGEQKEFDLKDLPIDLDGEFRSKSVTVKDLYFKNILAIIKASNGAVTVNPIYTETLGGNIKIVGKATGGGKKLASGFKLIMNDLQTEQILKTFVDSKRLFLISKLSTDLDLTTRGMDKDSVLSNMNGKGSFIIKDGVIKGFGYNPKKDLLGNLTLFGDDKTTSLEPMKGIATITNGKFTVQKMKFTSGDLRGDITGGFHLKDLGLDFDVNVFVGMFNAPMKITGSFVKPSFKIDEKALMNSLIEDQKRQLEEKAKKELEKQKKKVEDKAKKEIDREKKKLEDKAKKEASKALNNLFR